METRDGESACVLSAPWHVVQPPETSSQFEVSRCTEQENIFTVCEFPTSLP